MENIVYFLGAGFSAPLGIPVMKDFLIKAKDLYFRDKDKYSHFVDILRTIDRMHKAKTYFQTDLLNIEEVLSILDMEDYVSGTDHSDKFRKFIEDVVRAYTPAAPEPYLEKHRFGKGYTTLNKNSANALFGQNEWRQYGPFVCNLLRQQLRTEPIDTPLGSAAIFLRSLNTANSVQYSVVTLNYDLVFETIIESLGTHTEPLNKDMSLLSALPIAKLHGSVGGRIVAPTWKKHADETLRPAWKAAYESLCAATQIRILGYSLPVADAYVRYLLEAAILNSEHLKKIDIICLDDRDASMEKHYRDFIHFKFTRFRSADISAYLLPADPHEHLWSITFVDDFTGRRTIIRYDRIEDWHEAFMKQTR